MLNDDDTRLIDIYNYSYGAGMLLMSDGNKIMYHVDENGKDKKICYEK